MSLRECKIQNKRARTTLYSPTPSPTPNSRNPLCLELYIIILMICLKSVSGEGEGTTILNFKQNLRISIQEES